MSADLASRMAWSFLAAAKRINIVQQTSSEGACTALMSKAGLVIDTPLPPVLHSHTCSSLGIYETHVLPAWVPSSTSVVRKDTR